MNKKSDSKVCISQVIMMGFTFAIASFFGVKMYNVRVSKLAAKVYANTEIEVTEEALVENNEEDYVRFVNNEYLEKKEVTVSRGGNPVRTTTVAEEKAKEEVKKEEKVNEEVKPQVEEKKVEVNDNKNVQTHNVENVESENLVPPTEYKNVLDVKATAYCLCKSCCGKSVDSPGYGVTASGLKIIPNTGMKVIAVDPKVIPLGSKVYVEGLNGVPDYGYAIAADTGGAIKNMKIDLYMDSHKDTDNWGIKNVRVYVLGK